MAKRTPQSFQKRQREMDKKRKAADKRRLRQERKEGKGEGTDQNLTGYGFEHPDFDNLPSRPRGAADEDAG